MLTKINPGIKYFSFDSIIPTYGKEANIIETAGALFLTPTYLCLNALIVKRHPNEAYRPILQKILSITLAIFTLPLTIIGIILKEIGSILPHKKNLSTDIAKTPTNPTHIELCYEQAKIFKEVCLEQNFVDKNGIPLFWGISGTALGIERHEGMIPWDDDIDLAILEENEAALTKMEEALKARGLIINRLHRKFQGLYKLQFTEAALKDYQKTLNLNSLPQSPDLDLMIWSKMTDDSYAHTAHLSRSTWPTEYILKDEMEAGIEEAKFGDQSKNFTIPCLTKKARQNYLKRLYGADCLKFGINTHSHIKIMGISFSISCLKAHRFQLTSTIGNHATGITWK